MRFPALLDTNVLYGALLNDLVLTLADHGLFRPLWSEEILTELKRNLRRSGESRELSEKRVSTMMRYFPDAMVTGYEALVSTMTNDPKDRHVLAAAIRGGAEVLVTFNLKDFPPASLQGYDVEVVHPDTFLLDQLDLHPARTRQALVELVANYENPAMTVHDFLLALTRAAVPEFAEAARQQLF